MEVREASADYAGLTELQDDVVSFGRRQTEARAFPKDWTSRSVEELAARRSNAIVGGPFGSDLISKDYVSVGVPVIRGQNMSSHCVAGDFVFVSKAKAGQLRANLARPNDIVFTQRGTLGQVALVPAEPFDEYVVSQSQMKLTLRPDVASAEYVYQYFISDAGQKQVLESAIQTGVPHTNLSILRGYRVPTPPTVAEQEAIAEALSDADALIESLQQLIAKKRQIKQGTMQALLTGTQRLPGFTGKWKPRQLGQIGRCLRGVSYRGDSDLSTHDTKFTIRLLRSNNVQGSIVVTEGIQFVNEKRVSNAQIMKKDDVLLCMANGSKALVGKSGIFMIADGYSYTFGAFMGCFRAEAEDVNPAFVFSLFQTSRYGKYINNLLAGSSINNLTPGSIESMEFLFPVVGEQTAIATILTDMDAELAELETRLAKTCQLKQGMMQELLTGRIRLI